MEVQRIHHRCIECFSCVANPLHNYTSVLGAIRDSFPGTYNRIVVFYQYQNLMLTFFI